MGLMDRLRGESGAAAPQGSGEEFVEGVPVGMRQAEPVLKISDAAKEKIRAALASQEPAAPALRVLSQGRGRYAMNLEPEGKPGLDDTVLPYPGFQVFVDPQSLTHVEGASLDYVETFGGGGFQFTNPNDQPARRPRKEVPEGPDGERWRQIQTVLDEDINPAVASHGGYIDLIDVQGSTVYVEMGGGCQGCAMSRMTLKQGVERMLKASVPDVEEVLDVTDHAEGRNPYYAQA